MQKSFSQPPASSLPAHLPLLRQGAQALGEWLSSTQVELFAQYRALLQEWNRRVNLTAITDDSAVETGHFLDSLTALPLLPAPLPEGFSVLDVGAGAGFPGVPLRIMRPGLRLTLLESVGKKARFLEAVRKELGLEDVTIVQARAEDAGQQPELRERFDLVAARAVAAMATLAELCLPFCAIGGRFIAYKKGDISTEMADAQEAIQVLGGQVEEVRPVRLPALADGRALVVVRKVAPTPAAYPRRAGVPAKRPLSARGRRP